MNLRLLGWIVLALACVGATEASETRKYYLTEQQWNHLAGVLHTTEKEAVEDEAKTLSEAVSRIGSRLTEAGLKIEDLNLVNRWELHVTAGVEAHDRLETILDFFAQNLFIFIQVQGYAVPEASLEVAGLALESKPTLQPIISGAERSRLIAQISASPGSSSFAVPSVMARNGQSARIEVVREVIYPESYSPPTFPKGAATSVGPAGSTSATAFPVTPSNPTNFTTRTTGLTLDFLPLLQLDGAVNLQIRAENVILEEFTNFGSPIYTGITNGSGEVVQVLLTENRVEQPSFTTSRFKGSMEIESEASFLITGYRHEREEVEAIELLMGRAKRTKELKMVRTNVPAVLIFTATVLGPDGKPPKVDIRSLKP